MKRKGCICIIVVITMLICLSLLRIKLNEETKWYPPISHLSWGMSLEEVEKKYELVHEESTQIKEYEVIPMSEVQTIYGQEMKVSLYFHTIGSGGLARIVGYFDESQEEELFGLLRDEYGGYEKFWNNQHVEEVYSQEQIKQVYRDIMRGEVVSDTIIDTMGKKPLCYIKLGEVENGYCAFIMDATMELMMNMKK